MDEVSIATTKIKRKSDSKNPEHMYLHGGCLIFAKKLQEEVGGGDIKYLPIYNHFVLKYNNKLYDVRGNITNTFKNEKMIALEDVPTGILGKYKG